MSQRSAKSTKHPDDFMVVSVSLQFQAKHNPDVADPQPLDFTELENTFLAADGDMGGRADTQEALLSALQTGGIEFIEENGGGAGVRLAKRQRRSK